MHSLNKVLCFSLLISLTSSVPVLAYSSGNDIVITRKAAPKKALLDRKFIFMQEAKAPITNTPRLAELNNYSTKSLVPIKASNISHPKQNTINDSNWDSYAEEVDVELEESLGVAAKLLNTH